MNKELDKLIDLMFDADIDIEEIVKEENILEYIKKIKQASNEKIESLYKTIDAQNKTINEQALEISQLKEQKKQAIEYIKNGVDFKSLHFIKGKDEDMWKIILVENVKNELLEILGDKENVLG